MLFNSLLIHNEMFSLNFEQIALLVHHGAIDCLVDVILESRNGYMCEFNILEEYKAYDPTFTVTEFRCTKC